MFGRSYKPGTGLMKRDRRREWELTRKCIRAFLTRRPELHAMPAGDNWPGVCLWCGKNDDAFYEYLEAELDRQDFKERHERMKKEDEELLKRLGDE